MNVGRRRGLQALFVEPYQQIKIGLIFLLLNFAFCSLIGAVFGYYIYDIYTSLNETFKLTHGESADTFSKLQIPIIIGITLLLGFVASTLWVSVKYTHRIYGPLVSVYRYLDEIAAGKDPAPLQLRDRDQLSELADKLNAAVKKLKS
jgi:hypothetical protein